MREEAWEKKKFVRGSIRWVRMENFMTYDETEFVPGPRLNMVIGANGSGKSTIVCALALGFGGSLDVLQRAETLQGFIKNGRNTAFIEIHLEDETLEGGLCKITCEITRKAKQRSYTLNGESLTEKKFQQEIKKRYDIQVDNLCQFLPQDKVSHFSKLNKRELLDETIRAGLGPRRVEQKYELMQRQRELKEKDNNGKREKEALEGKEALLAQLAKEVELVERKRALQKELKNLQDCLAYTEFDRARVDFKEYKERVKEMKKGLDGKRREVAALRDELKELQEANQSASPQDLKDWNESIARAKARKGLHFAEAKKLDVSMDTSLESIAQFHTEQQSIEDKIASAEEKVKTSEHAMASFIKDCGDLGNIREELREIKKEKTDIEATFRDKEADLKLKKHSRGELTRDLEKIEKALEKLQMLEQCKESRIDNLPGKLQNRARAQYSQLEKWRQESKLSKDVYLVLLELNSKTSNDAIFIERGVAKHQMLTFVTTCAHDREFLMSNSEFTVMNVEHIRGPRHTLSQDLLDKLKARYLDDVVDAPPPVKQALCNIAKIDKVLVGTQETEEILHKNPELKAKLAGYRLFTTEKTFRWIKSKYDNEIKTTVETHKHAKAEIITKDQNKVVQERKEKIMREKIDTEMRLESSEKEYIALKKYVEEKKKLFDQVMNRYREKTEVVKAGNELNKDLENAKRTLKSALKAKESRKTESLASRLTKFHTEALGMLNVVECSRNIFVEASHAQEKTLLVWAKEAEKSAQLVALQNRKEVAEAELKRMESEIAMSKSKQDKMKQTARRLKEEFEKLNADMDALEALPHDVDELNARINVCKGNLRAFTANDGAIQTYETLKAEIDELRVRVHNHAESQQREQQGFDDDLKAWTDEVERIIGKVSENFTAAFENASKVEFNGEGYVELIQDSGDIGQFGIGIYVKFRKDYPFNVLDERVQSGGERSLTTFLYLLALNEVSKVPFRVVDEINQGMDEKRERILFRQLVGSSCGNLGADRAQYFLVTPKLLTGLRYHRDMKVHVVFNGPGALPQSKFKLDQMLSIAEKLGKRKLLDEHVHTDNQANKKRKVVAAA